MKSNLAKTQSWPAKTDPVEVLDWATKAYEGQIALSTSLGPQTLVIIDMLAKLGRKIPVFVLDTGVLFPQTIALWRQVEDRYGIEIEGVRPALSLEDQALALAPELWNRDPDQCCSIRKVAPLEARLEGLGAWITGLRRGQSTARVDTATVEWDHGHGLVKVNPLAWWSRFDVWAYAAQHSVPLNPLLNEGYRSIGCLHCTHRVRHDQDPGDERAGRWSGTEKTECGIHFPTLLKTQG